MDKKELLKNYWFVGLVGLALLIFVGIYAADAYKNREITVSNKQVDGKYVAYTLDGEVISADDLYDTLYETSGLSKAVIAYERAIFAQAYETTDEMKTTATNQAASYLAYYSEDYILENLKAMGYTNGIDDFVQYYIDANKQELLIKDYVAAHISDYVTPLVGTEGRLIYHILVKCDTTEVTDENGNVIGYEANPTDEQKEKLTQILDALEDENNTFEYVAYLYSEDSSNSYGGYIGMINEENRDNYDMVFAETSMNLSEGEVSDPIVSQFGYHIIYNAAQSDEAFLNDYYFMSELQSDYPTMALKAVMEKGEELGFEIKDEELKAQINAQLEEN